MSDDDELAVEQRRPVELESDEKVEGITMEYTFLLTSQLDSQRRYFEEKLMHAETSAVERVRC